MRGGPRPLGLFGGVVVEMMELPLAKLVEWAELVEWVG